MKVTTKNNNYTLLQTQTMSFGTAGFMLGAFSTMSTAAFLCTIGIAVVVTIAVAVAIATIIIRDDSTDNNDNNDNNDNDN